MTMTLEQLARDLWWHANNACTLKDRERYVGWADAIDARLTQPAQSVDDSALLNFMERECVTVRCEATDDDDVEWDVVSYHMDAPKERVIGTGATPREALTAALQEKGNG